MPLTLPHFVTKSLNNPAYCTCHYLLFPRVFSLWGLSYHFKHICVRFRFLRFWHRNKRSFLGIINLGLCCIHRLCPSLHVLCNLRHKEFEEKINYYGTTRKSDTFVINLQEEKVYSWVNNTLGGIILPKQ